MSGQLEVRLGEQRVDACTVFNNDIRGFTTMSENSRPEELVEMLNGYFELIRRGKSAPTSCPKRRL